MTSVSHKRRGKWKNWGRKKDIRCAKINSMMTGVSSLLLVITLNVNWLRYQPKLKIKTCHMGN